jgi:hydroxymethylbilane synthase
LWQANYLQTALAENGLESTIHIIKTKGDQIQHLSFDKIEGKGFFTKEIEDALLDGTVDLAIHSMKDLPTSSPEGLSITGVSYREDPADWLLIRKERTASKQLMQLPEGAVVGTSSSRRQAQLLHFRSDLILKDIRGNVPTRVEKLRRGDFDAIVLAGAGLKRLKLDVSDLTIVKFNPQEFVPAPAQGVLAYQVRTADTALRRKLLPLHEKKVADCTNIERQVLKLMDGGCQMPLGVYCKQDPMGNYHIWAAWASGAKEALTTVNLSSSTRFELAEKTVAALMGKE